MITRLLSDRVEEGKGVEVENCPFCRILAGELTGAIVYQDEICTAIMDIQPINPGHLLLVTNQHLSSLGEIPNEIRDQLFACAQKLAAAVLRSGMQCEGINLLLADGPAAGQQVPHFHLHIIPRYQGDSFEFHFSPRYAELPTRDELEKNAFHIRLALESHEEG